MRGECVFVYNEFQQKKNSLTKQEKKLLENLSNFQLEILFFSKQNFITSFIYDEMNSVFFGEIFVFSSFGNENLNWKPGKTMIIYIFSRLKKLTTSSSLIQNAELDSVNIFFSIVIIIIIIIILILQLYTDVSGDFFFLFCFWLFFSFSYKLEVG